MKDTEKTIAQIFWARAYENADKTLFIYSKEGDDPPYRNENGELRTMSWREAAEKIQNVGMGLLELGARRGDSISILSGNRPEWIIADLALLSIGCKTGTIWLNNPPDFTQYVLNDLDSPFLFVEGTSRRDGMLERKSVIPHLKKIITIGCDAGDDPLCMTFEDLEKLGKEYANKHSSSFIGAVAAGSLDEIATCIYTPGINGIPRGAVHKNKSITYTISTASTWFPVEPGYTDFSLMPMAHIFEQFVGPFFDIYMGNIKVAFARSMNTLTEDIGIIKPDFSRSAPRLFEKFQSSIIRDVEPLTGLTHDQFNNSLEVAKRVRVEGELEGKPVSTEDRRLLKKYDAENFSRIRNKMLGGNLKFFIGSGAPFSREIHEFFWSIGVNIYECYGMTETGGATTNRPGHVKLGTIGKTWPSYGWPGDSCETTVSGQGEIIMRSPSLMVEYNKKPDETAEVMPDGWMHSGDVAEVDKDGFFKITDRIKDIIVVAGGKNIPPLKLEELLEEDPLISGAVVYGDNKKFITALVILDETELSRVGKALKLEGSYEKLRDNPIIKNKVKEIIAEKNRSLASYETIKNFAIIDHDPMLENGILAPLSKRKEVYHHYSALLDSLYPED